MAREPAAGQDQAMPDSPCPPAGVILVFARAPVAGRCKTRLIPRLGRRGAARWHARQVRRTVAVAAATGLPVQLWSAPDAGHALFLRCRRDYGVSLRRQSKGDLGRRMAQALGRSLRADGARALLIGSDCPVLDAAQLRAALAALDDADAVLQPAEDGGYVLIGSRRPLNRALQGIDWSSGRELRQTRLRLRRQGLRVTERPTLWDVDEPGDLRRARRLGLG